MPYPILFMHLSPRSLTGASTLGRRWQWTFLTQLVAARLHALEPLEERNVYVEVEDFPAGNEHNQKEESRRSQDCGPIHRESSGRQYFSARMPTRSLCSVWYSGCPLPILFIDDDWYSETFLRFSCPCFAASLVFMRNDHSIIDQLLSLSFFLDRSVLMLLTQENSNTY